jgi:hypothetical protein
MFAVCHMLGLGVGGTCHPRGGQEDSTFDKLLRLTFHLSLTVHTSVHANTGMCDYLICAFLYCAVCMYPL